MEGNEHSKPAKERREERRTNLNRTHARQETPQAEKNAEPTVVRPRAAPQGHNFCSLTNSFYHSKFPKMRWGQMQPVLLAMEAQR
jgi:hypothetical protein